MIFSRGFTIGGNLPASFDNRAFYGAVRSNKRSKDARLRDCADVGWNKLSIWQLNALEPHRSTILRLVMQLHRRMPDALRPASWTLESPSSRWQ